MIIQTIEVALIMPNELKQGHRIVNVGIVKCVEEYKDCFVVEIYGREHYYIRNPKYAGVTVLAENGYPKIIEYTY